MKERVFSDGLLRGITSTPQPTLPIPPCRLRASARGLPPPKKKEDPTLQPCPLNLIRRD